MEEINTTTLSSPAFLFQITAFSKWGRRWLLCTEAKVLLKCWWLFRHLKQNTKRCSSSSGCYNGLQKRKKKTILTIQTVKYFEQIGHFAFVQSAKIPHVRSERLYTPASNVIVKSADHTLVWRALGGIGRI